MHLLHNCGHYMSTYGSYRRRQLEHSVANTPQKDFYYFTGQLPPSSLDVAASGISLPIRQRVPCCKAVCYHDCCQFLAELFLRLTFPGLCHNARPVSISVLCDNGRIQRSYHHRSAQCTHLLKQLATDCFSLFVLC